MNEHIFLSIAPLTFGAGLILCLFGSKKSKRSHLYASVPQLSTTGNISRVESGFKPFLILKKALFDYPQKNSKFKADLTITQTSFDDLLARSARLFLIGLLLPAALIYFLRIIGVLKEDLLIPEAMDLILAIVFGLLPLVEVTKTADKKRREARMNLSAIISLVVLYLSGGMGIEESVVRAVNLNHADFSNRLREKVYLSQELGQPLWKAFVDVGNSCGIPELSEVGYCLCLSGEEGSRIRDSLKAKSAFLRTKVLQEKKAEANKTTEKLFLPGTVLLLGFLIYLGYPAMYQILAGFK